MKNKILNFDFDSDGIKSKIRDRIKSKSQKTPYYDDYPTQREYANFRTPKKRSLSVGMIKASSDDSEALSKIASNSIFNDGEYLYLSLSGITIAKSAFIFTDLTGSNFSKSILKGCDFTFANLQNCDFTNTVIENCLFRHTNLKNANFTGANIIFSDFTGADFLY